MICSEMRRTQINYIGAEVFKKLVSVSQFLVIKCGHELTMRSFSEQIFVCIVADIGIIFRRVMSNIDIQFVQLLGMY